MKNVLIVGAHGQVGQLLTDKLNEAPDFTPVALIRKEEQRELFAEKGVEARVASLEDSVASLSANMQGIDAVVFSAGSGGSTGSDKTLTIDLDGAVKCMEAAQRAGIRRFVMLSALHTDDRNRWTDAEGMKPYYVAKHYADRVLKGTGLDYTIVRPGALKNEEGTGRINTENPDETKSVPRDDVAQVILEVLQQDSTIGQIITFNRGDTPIEEALTE
ncbi:SDR family oxidoreductase [Neolewinella litorea]|uniref:SDR family oxidoreductase n=1 Tax=Neolewinella litorea TaxID=2562452 RepID=A0A4S4NAW0_9BACT|nr:SDR family oxidoreductase [Neolewinella litorea]THH35587.1 SDR family oxidoreductase [Neolewinella litorea]